MILQTFEYQFLEYQFQMHLVNQLPMQLTLLIKSLSPPPPPLLDIDSSWELLERTNQKHMNTEPPYEHRTSLCMMYIIHVEHYQYITGQIFLTTTLVM